MNSDCRLGLGTGHLRNSEECEKTVKKALDLGYRHFDTAEIYSNERAIGNAIERSPVPRDDLFLATKVHSQNLNENDVFESVKSSREALGVRMIDLVYVHWPAHTYDPNETLPALATLRSEGVIRHIGLSNFTIELLTEARTAVDAPIFAVQVEMHPFLQQNQLYDYTRNHDIELVAHTPLCRGEVVQDPIISSIATKYNISEIQVSLAWLLEKEGLSAIPSARGNHLKENIMTQYITLDNSDIRKIENIEKTRRYISYEFAPWEG